MKRRIHWFIFRQRDDWYIFKGKQENMSLMFSAIPLKYFKCLLVYKNKQDYLHSLVCSLVEVNFPQLGKVKLKVVNAYKYFEKQIMLPFWVIFSSSEFFCYVLLLEGECTITYTWINWRNFTSTAIRKQWIWGKCISEYWTNELKCHNQLC